MAGGKDATSALTAALKSVYEDARPTPGFAAAPSWQGARPGCYFGTADQGTGYYRDPKQRGAQGSTAAGLAAAVPAGNEAAEAAAVVAPLDGEGLLREAEALMNVDDIQQLDAKGVKRLVVTFERKYKENQDARMKYADQPDKFLDSEVDLDEHVKSLMQVAGYPDMYPVMLDQPGCVPALLALLSHENTDIAADAIELLSELTGADAVSGYEAEGQALVEALLEANAPELMVQRLTTLNEEVDDEAAAVNRLLQVFENLVEVKPQVADELVTRTTLLPWLLTRIKKRGFDGNKQYASEVLAILVQGNPVMQRKLLAANGVDVLLLALSQYKSRDPGTADEEEFMQNCFDVLCACIMLPECKLSFLKAEGVELMTLMLSGKARLSRFGAVRLLDFATSGSQGACDKLVDSNGLKSLFGLFMGKSKAKGPKGERDVTAEVEERAVSIIGNLLAGLARGARRERVAAKFVEAEFEKCDRLFEVYFRYANKVADEERRLADNLLAERGEGEEEEEEEVAPGERPIASISEDELLVARLGAGLFTLQQAALIVGHLWATSDPGLRRRILQLLHQQGQSLASVRDCLLEFYETIGNVGGPEEQDRQRAKLRTVLDALGGTAASNGHAAAAGAAPPLALTGAVPPAAGEAMPPPPPPPSAAASGSGRAAGRTAVAPKMEPSEAEPTARSKPAAERAGGAGGQGRRDGEDEPSRQHRGGGGAGDAGHRDERRAAAAVLLAGGDRDARRPDREAGAKEAHRGDDVRGSGRDAQQQGDDDSARGGTGCGRESSPPAAARKAHHSEKEHRRHKERTKDVDFDADRGRDKERGREKDAEREGGRDKERMREKERQPEKERVRESRHEGKHKRDDDEREERRAHKRDKRSLSR